MRERLRSRLGFLMLAAGCAVGLGNVWRFPFVTGGNGGAAFVLIYLFFLAALGFPLLTAELAIGRGSRRGIAAAMRKLSLGGGAARSRTWGAVGTVIFAGNALLMFYYTDIGGWLLDFTMSYAVMGAPPKLSELAADRAESLAFMLATVAAASAVCGAGLQKGVERFTKAMMLTLLALMGVLAVRALTLPGAAKGVEFYLKPDWSHLAAHPWKTVIAAMGQAFFTLSVGVGCMTVFGSYVGRGMSLVGESAWIVLIDTFVAFTAGLIIFPACATYGVAVNAGPGLIFEALPKVFAEMSGGRVWGTVFFFFLTLAAVTTVVAVFECLIGGLMEAFGWRRGWTAAAVGALVAAGSLPAVMCGGALEAEDFVFSQLWLPTGAMLISVFVSTRAGWGFEKFSAEASAGEGIRLPRAFGPLLRYFVPLMILILVIGAAVTS